MYTPLREGWTVRAVGGPVPPQLAGVRVPATVPGCVHTDLLAAALIPDPYLDENEAALSWIGEVDWCYETAFEWAGGGGQQVELVALGLDTVATVRLNGETIAETANMHRSYRIDVGGSLRVGRNELAVTFRAGRAAARERSEALGPRPHVNAHPFNAVRKMAASYGWDWGPDLVTAGIWRPIGLRAWTTARLAEVRPVVRVDGDSGVVQAHVSVRRAGDVQLIARVTVGEHVVDAPIAPGTDAAVITLRVPGVERWWPHDLGAQPRYPMSVTLHDSAGGELDSWQRRIGFRTVELDVSPDEHGTSFTLRVNGRPIFARGANWIPDDCFPSRVDASRYAERVRQARDANVNLLRVWGGGIYESDEFYDACDELGVLVWQDFLFACAAYAEEEPLRGEVIAEAREAIVRLSPHPSLAVWNGSNENVWGHADWGWPAELDGRSWGYGYYTDLLPRLLAELDPTRPYSPSSPYSPQPDAHPNDPAHGTMHIWDVWNARDYTAYGEYVPRFLSEFGFQGPATTATIARAISERPLVPDSPAMLAHQKAEDGQDKLARGLAGHLPEPNGFDDWHWATSLNQARAIRFGVEHFRSYRPVCMGTIVWQLNDCWPATSWSAIDGDGRRKPLWYALRRSYRDRLLTVQPRSGGLAVVAVNDGASGWQETVTVRRVSFDGATAASADIALDVPPGASVTVALDPELTAAADPRQELILVDAVGQRALRLFADDVDAALPAPEFDCTVQASDGQYRVTVRARTLLRDLALLADRLAPEAAVDEQLVTLLPGESVTFVVDAPAGLEAAAFADPTVLRCANQLGHARVAPVRASVSALP